MNILFLDDNDKRISLAREAFSGDNLTIANSAESAIRILGNLEEKWDLVMLDYDLGGEANGWGAGHDPTGMDVVDYIVMYHPSIERIVVHSWNPVSTYMVDKLWRSGYKAEWKRFSIMQ